MSDEQITAAQIAWAAADEAGKSVDECWRAAINAAEQSSAIPRPLSEWHEEIGDVLWWKFPIVEPPYCGSPLDIGRPVHVTVWSHRVDESMLVNVGGWPGYHTHWTPISVPSLPASPVPCVSDEASETGESEG